MEKRIMFGEEIHLWEAEDVFDTKYCLGEDCEFWETEHESHEVWGGSYGRDLAGCVAEDGQCPVLDAINDALIAELREAVEDEQTA